MTLPPEIRGVLDGALWIGSPVSSYPALVEQLVIARRLSGLPQTTVAEMIGLHEAALSHAEIADNSPRRWIGARALIDWVDVLGLCLIPVRVEEPSPEVFGVSRPRPVGRPKGSKDVGPRVRRADRVA